MAKPRAKRRPRKAARPIVAGRPRPARFVPAVLLLLAAGALAWILRGTFNAAPPPAPSASPVPVIPVTPAAPLPRSTPPAPAVAPPTVAFTPPPPIPEASGYPRLVANLLEAQIALARLHFSSGSIDGVAGAQTAAALSAFQQSRGLPVSGRLDDATRARLVLDSPPIETVLVEPADLAGLLPLSPTWLGKSEQTALAHETFLERLAERTHAHPNLLRRLNPGADWAAIAPGAAVLAPSIRRAPPDGAIAHLHVKLAERILQARDTQGALVAHYPVSIAKRVDKRPVGALRVVVVVPDPNYTFDPAVFPESAEARELGRKLILPPGPNNPVGVAWIGLDRPGYGIHGTPTPELVGRTESHGCFRLANWDARSLLGMARAGLPVYVEP